MGVYVFRCLAGAWIKVGHFKMRWGGRSTRRVYMDNPWFRVERRGFHSVVHPADLQGRLCADDLELVAWYPALTGRCEGRIHRAFAAERVGAHLCAHGTWRDSAAQPRASSTAPRTHHVRGDHGPN